MYLSTVLFSLWIVYDLQLETDRGILPAADLARDDAGGIKSRMRLEGV
jgi:hypothetical protein